jgi:phosphoribosylformylglycinamidine cyclo-ligase
MTTKMTYKDSGVDIDKGDELVEKIKLKVKKTYGSRVKSGVGGFACLYEVGDRYLSAGTDGVGTKLKLAFELGIHNTIGIDLVAMCVNDILCTGSRPLFFMDYLATGQLELNTNEQIIEGVVEGCLASECALIGGETAEMPGMYNEGEYDLAGFAVGEVYPAQILGGEKVTEGMSLIALKSSGFHSNGYSLVRKVCSNWSHEEKVKLLAPTKIYWKAVKSSIEKDLICGMSHITGGGLLNLPRMNSNLDYNISMTESAWKECFYTAEMHKLENEANLNFEDMARTFNCGTGMIIAASSSKRDELLSELKACGESPIVIGTTTKGSGAVHFEDKLTLS